jgi:hypothetical protein
MGLKVHEGLVEGAGGTTLDASLVIAVPRPLR